MKTSLLFSYYPKCSNIATLVLKSPESFFRINYLWRPSKLLSDLEELCRVIGRGRYLQVDLELKDKRERRWLLVCSFADKSAQMVLSEPEVEKIRFSWVGTVNQFVLAVTRLLMTVR